MKLNAWSFALAGGVFLAIVFAVTLVLDRLGLVGAHAAFNAVEKIFGTVGAQRSWFGLLMSVIWGFITGFIVVGFFGVLYNSMSPEKK